MAAGEIQFKKKLTREQFRVSLSKLAPSEVIFEACGSANYWAGQMEAMGHQAKLIAPQFVRPFVKRLNLISVPMATPPNSITIE